MKIAVSGGAGYIGAGLVRRLLRRDDQVVVLDALLHSQREVAASLERAGAAVIVGDIRDVTARRAALDGAQALVHLAAIVGDPACARDSQLAHAVNVEGSQSLIDDAAAAGVGRLVFASTCANYGRMEGGRAAVDEDAPLRPVSLYAEQKVAIERELLDGGAHGPIATCVRLATVYGVAERMRFDLTVNEFTRDLWDDRRLEVFGEQFWRPYLHVLDAAEAICLVLDAPQDAVARGVFNVGDSDENYRKADLIEIIRAQVDRGEVRFVHRDEDPRDYRVDFSRIRRELGFAPARRVPDGVQELITALEEGHFGDPFDCRFRN